MEPIELEKIVRWPASVQAVKGLATAGLVKSARYAASKASRWWGGR